MSEIPFVKTVAGRQLVEKDVSNFIREIRLLRRAAERIAAALETKTTPDTKEPERS